MRFSADGRRVAYIWDRNGYQIELATLGGERRRTFIYRNPPGTGEVLAYDWSNDGAYIAAVVAAPSSPMLRLALIRVADGSVITLRDLEGVTYDRMRGGRMSFSPDGRFLAFDLLALGSTARDIFIRDLHTGTEVVAVHDPADDRLFDWTPDGTALLFWSDRGGTAAVWLQRTANGKNAGVPERFAELQGGAHALGFDRHGTYYLALPETRRHELFMATFDPNGRRLRDVSALSSTAGPRSAPDWSPDGKRLAYIDNGSIVIRSFESGEERRLHTPTLTRIFTVGTGEQYLRWSPDGRSLLLPQNRTIFRVDVSTSEVTAVATDRRSRYGRWSPDGTSIYYTRQIGANDAIAELVRLDLATQNKKVIHRASLPGDHYSSLEISPDGNWLAYSAVAAAPAPHIETTTLVVIPTREGAARTLVNLRRQEWIKVVGWTPDSREILFTRGRKLGTGQSTSLWSVGLVGGNAAKAIDVQVPVLHAIRFHPDGRAVAFDSGLRGFEIWTLEGLPLRNSRRK